MSFRRSTEKPALACARRERDSSGNERPRNDRLGYHAVFALSFVVVLSACVCGCGYHVVGKGSNLPAGWKAIAVPEFVNRTTHYRIEQRFTQAIIREFLQRTSYKIVQNEAAADGVLRGEVLSIETSPILFDANTGQVTTMLITVHAKVQLMGREDEKPVFKNDDLVFREEYQISGDVRSFFEEQNPALDRMSRDFAARVVGDVVEGF